MDPEMRQALEAILFVVDEPVDVVTLSQVLEIGREQVEGELAALAAEYERDGRGFVLREVAGGWRLYSVPAADEYVERFVLSGRTGRLSQAALETLAVIAYKQPISRHEIGEIRGVSAEGPVRTLVQRGLVEEVGRDDGPGQAVLYGTTREFLERVGLSTVDALPALTTFLAEGPAPDEPSPGSGRAARAQMAADDRAAAAEAGWSSTAGTSQRAVDADMGELTESLERVARAASSQLRRALSAMEPVADGSDDGEDGAEMGGP